jgi:UDP-glucuronate decarboxylase
MHIERRILVTGGAGFLGSQMVVELTGSRSKIVYAARPEDDPRQRRPDISRANELLSWVPKMSLR